jgi:hypothetical protein
MNASVRATQDGNKQVFELEPGRIYHVKELRVVGRGGLPAEAMAGAPASGEMYSTARMHDWMTTINKQYARRANWGATYDHAKAEVTIEVRLDPRQLWQAHTAASITWPLVDRKISHCLSLRRLFAQKGWQTPVK